MPDPSTQIDINALGDVLNKAKLHLDEATRQIPRAAASGALAGRLRAAADNNSSCNTACSCGGGGGGGGGGGPVLT